MDPLVIHVSVRYPSCTQQYQVNASSMIGSKAEYDINCHALNMRKTNADAYTIHLKMYAYFANFNIILHLTLF